MPNTDSLDRTLFISDNLPFLQSLDTESVDLVVIDPPFGKNQTFEGTLRPPLTDEELGHEYDLLSRWGIQNENDAYEAGVEFPDQSRTTATFSDIWNFRYQITQADWDRLDKLCRPARHLIEATRYTHSESTAAYITFMTMRMLEIRRILKASGSVYLHCDHEANAYLRQMMDAVFGPTRFKNEITWKRTTAHSDSARYGANTDTILFYSKGDKWAWNPQYQEYDEKYTARYRFKDPDGRAWTDDNLTAKGLSGGGYTYEYKGVTSYWRVPIETMEQLDAEGRLHFTKNGGIRRKRYLDEQKGRLVQALWDDIAPINSQAAERVGYPTQKPQALARRIIEVSSNPGDLVLDCFAGCAYVPVAAELTGRHWIACDMSPRAWTVVRRQFQKQADLRIITEFEYARAKRVGERVPQFEESAYTQPDLGDERIIRVRGPKELPERATLDAPQKRSFVPDLPPPEFRQRAVESGQTIWDAFVREWGTRCWYCGTEKARDRRELELDHIEPNKRDGTNDDCWNRALACAPCNSDKDDKLTVEQTIDKALAAGRIQTPALRDEQVAIFEQRHEWAKARWEGIRGG